MIARSHQGKLHKMWMLERMWERTGRRGEWRSRQLSKCLWGGIKRCRGKHYLSSVNFRLSRIRQESKAVISYSLFLYFFLSIPPSQQLFPSSPSPSGFSLNLRVGLQDISKSLWLWKTLAVHSLDLSSKFVLLHLLLFRFAILLGKPLP